MELMAGAESRACVLHVERERERERNGERETVIG